MEDSEIGSQPPGVTASPSEERRLSSSLDPARFSTGRNSLSQQTNFAYSSPAAESQAQSEFNLTRPNTSFVRREGSGNRNSAPPSLQPYNPAGVANGKPVVANVSGRESVMSTPGVPGSASKPARKVARKRVAVPSSAGNLNTSTGVTNSQNTNTASTTGGQSPCMSPQADMLPPRKRIKQHPPQPRVPLNRPGILDTRPEPEDWGGMRASSSTNAGEQWYRKANGELDPLCIKNYVFGQKVGQGSYGSVYVGRFANGSVVAIKKLIMPCKRREGVSKSALRELMLLQELSRYKHENVVDLKAISLSQPSLDRIRGSLFCIFEFVPLDLPGFISDRKNTKSNQSKDKEFSLQELKCISKQILSGLKHIHSLNVVHRDIKTGNLLISTKGIVKIADFGLARRMEDELHPSPYTKRVITLWYRPPELLLGSQHYGMEVDVWSAGCVIAEILLLHAIFSAESEEKVLNRIWARCGTPPIGDLPLFEDYPLWGKMMPLANNRPDWTDVDKKGIDTKEFVNRMLALDPAQRFTATQALDHSWFTSHPPACKPHQIRIPEQASASQPMQHFVLKKRFDLFHS